MLIIVETVSLHEADGLIKDLSERLKRKIKKVTKNNRKIKFINGDTIKFVSINSQTDGLRADIAIGPHADCFTCGSKQPKRIWGTKDINYYLSNL